MSTNTDTKLARRSVIRHAGVALAAGLGATGTAAAHSHCESCEEDPDTFCTMECVATSTRARAYDLCPYDAMSHVTYVPRGETGFVVQECTDGCFQSVLVDFCGEQWWIRASELDATALNDCIC